MKQLQLLNYGVKNSELQNPIIPSTVFEGASLSKPLIAYAALKLCEKGILDLDTPIITYMNANDLNSITIPHLSAVTLRHILSHTSGFPTRNLKKGDLLKLEFVPGSQFAYSGESFRYLGQVLEKVTGTTLSSYMDKNVFGILKND